VRPTEQQHGAFEELRAASARALDALRAACPADRPLTPTGRMAAAEKWLEARLQAVRTLRPALDAFYRTLSDEQKIRWSAGADGDRYGDEDRRELREHRHEHHGHHHDRDSDDRGLRGESWRGEPEPRRDGWREDRGRYDERGGDPEDRRAERWREDDRERWRREGWREDDRSRFRQERWREDRFREQRWRGRSDTYEERM
jgi:hypothetical protein